MDLEREEFQELVAVQRDTVSKLRLELEDKENQIKELIASHPPPSIDDVDSDVDEEDEVADNDSGSLVDAEPSDSGDSGKKVFVRCRRVATDAYDDDERVRNEPVPPHGATTMLRAGEMSITGSLLSLNMSRDSGVDAESGSDSDSECDEDWNGDGNGHRTKFSSKRRCATIPPLKVSDGDSAESQDGDRETRITRPTSCPALSQLSQATTTMFTYDSHSHTTPSGGRRGKLRRLSLCSASDGDADDDIIVDGEFAETAGRRPASARLAPPSMDAVQINDSDDSKELEQVVTETMGGSTDQVTDNGDDEGQFDDSLDGDIPVITRIEIDGNWFNKKARAVIEWKGEEFKRKMADFKWLSRMLLLNSTANRVAPEYPHEIPSALWRRGYLKKRKNELNLYLMQCHSLPWIRRYKPYCDIFLESDKKSWKKKRDQFSKTTMQRIKQKKLTYSPKDDVVNAISSAYTSGDESETEVIALQEEKSQEKMKRVSSMPVVY